MKNIFTKTGLIIISVILTSLICYPCSALEDLSHFDIVYVGGSGPGNYSSIQAAIYDVSVGGTVFVYNGTYYEHHIIIDKKICLLGENKNSTVINVVGKYQGLQIYHDDVVVKGFTFRNNSFKFDWWCNSLLEINNSKNVVVEDNILISDYDNPANDERICGLCLLDSNSCVLRNNSFHDCSLLIFYFDHFENNYSHIRYFFHDIDKSNKVNGKPIYYYKNCEYVDVPSDAGQVIFVNTNHSTISGFENYNATINIQLCYSNDNTIENIKINDSLSGLWLHYSNYNTFKNIVVNRTDCSLFLWHSNYSFFKNNILPSITIEQSSDHNIFIKNHFRSSRSHDFSIQLESSDYNIFKCNNIYGENLLLAAITKDVTAVGMYKSHHTTWKNNYWSTKLREKNNFLANHLPKIIVGLHRGIYVPIPYFNFPSYINIDWHPADESYLI